MRERSVALVDIDNTVYQGYIVLDIIESQNRVGLLSNQGHDLMLKGAEKYKSAENYKSKELSYEDFAKQLLFDWAEGLKGIFYQQAREHAEDFLSGSTKFHPYSKKMKDIFSPTHDVYLVTGEPEFIAEPARDILQADGVLASNFEVDTVGIFTGSVSNYLAHRDEKRDCLEAVLMRYNGFNTFAFGDSDADLEMLKLVANPVCISPRGDLLIQARLHSWTICEPEDAIKRVMEILK